MSVPNVVNQLRASRLFWAVSTSAVVMTTVVAVLFSTTDLTASEAMKRFLLPALDVGPYSEVALESSASLSTLTLQQHELHPDHRFATYFTASQMDDEVRYAESERMRKFRNLIDMYVTRQGIDDNFTMRFIHEPTGDVLRLHSLNDERRTFYETGEADWPAIDRIRRQETRRIVDALEDAGYDRDKIVVRWGRANQMLEARERKSLVHEYELRLAELLDLSLLVTELSTVETFNQDELVSSAGARGRYQMMPAELRRHNIHTYRLPTASGGQITVREELHPLLTMESAFLMVRSHVNAFGSEIPGISAYHTGPNNIYNLLTRFVEKEPQAMIYPQSVLDGYVWALTDGFDLVSSESSFRTYSRGYVPSLYGALRATDHIPVDTTRTMRAEQVTVSAGESIALSDLLRPLALVDAFDWHPGPQHATPYEGFRAMNMHLNLPESEHGGVPTSGNIVLSARSGDHPVRFFLPIGAAAFLEERGVVSFDDNATRRYDENTYRVDPREVTQWDRQYATLVNRIGRFGFTAENKAQLTELAEKFDELYAADPSHYREMQRYAIQTHKRLWNFGSWERLAVAADDARERMRMRPSPPRQFEVGPSYPELVGVH